MLRDVRGASPRLLPWKSPEGLPCYLSTDDCDSRLSRLADAVEAELLEGAEAVLGLARGVLGEPGAGSGELRFAGVRLAEALEDALRVAVSRGVRLGG
ncbi:hypothetical protein ABZX30_18775 [Streptomyces sp. NPDC004542]|uniref:hypothetical protein n=1 Tax=Streptomyces sp. NPDC004542 TaxID=3154281 RepID=UPI0033B4745A